MKNQKLTSALTEAEELYATLDEDLAMELEEAVAGYMMSATEEAKGATKLTAAMLPAEVKEAMGLDIFPEDIQNDILALSQKIVEYAQTLAQPEEAKGPGFGPPTRYSQPGPSTMTRLANCFADVPSRQIVKDAWRSSSRADQVVKRVPALQPARTALRIGTFGAGMLGGALGSVTGCMQRTAPYR